MTGAKPPSGLVRYRPVVVRGSLFWVSLTHLRSVVKMTLPSCIDGFVQTNNNALLTMLDAIIVNRTYIMYIYLYVHFLGDEL